MHDSQDLAELLSLGGTPLTIGLAVLVVATWGREAWLCYQRPFRERTAGDWIKIGIALGFLAQPLDNGYWFFPWSLSYLEHAATDRWILNGVYFNIFFRQGLGSLAAWCHLKAAVVQGHMAEKTLKRWFIALNLIGVAYMAWLYLTMH